MRWGPYILKDGSYAQSTEASDAGYCVTRTRAVLPGVMELDAPIRYLAWHGRSGNAHFKLLGHYDTLEEARAVCEAHAAKISEVAEA